MKDLMLFCVQCDEPFIYSIKEQIRHSRQGFDPPRRCPACRQHKVRMDESEASRKNRRKNRARQHSAFIDEM